MPAMPRDQVYERINQERDYQEACRAACGWEPVGPETKPPESFLLYMRQYLDQAEKACLWSASKSRQDVLAAIRKVTALGVACLELHGCPLRDQKDVHRRADNKKRLS